MNKKENLINIILVSVVMLAVLALSLSEPVRDRNKAADTKQGSKKLGKVQYKQTKEMSILPMGL